MFRKIGIIISGALLLAGCQKDGKCFTVEGAIDGAEGETLYIQSKTLGGTTVIDSARLDKDGAYEFKVDAPESPEFYQLTLGNQVINFAVDSTETIRITASQPNMGANYRVEGSDNCEKIRELSLKLQQLKTQIYGLNTLPRREAADSLEQIVNRFKEDVTFNYIFKGPETTYAYYALFMSLNQQKIFDYNNPEDVKVFGAVATSWDTFYPESERAQHLHNTALKGITDKRIATARRQQAIEQANEKVVVSDIIDLSLPDASGKKRTLTELRGKVVLLDFHLFGMKDSSVRILKLRDLYNKYHAQGLEIYQVSADADEHQWKLTSQALPWICVHDPSGASLRSYNVQAMPEFFLIDRKNSLYKRSSQMGNAEEEIKRLLAQ